MDVTKEKDVKIDELEIRYERYKDILKDLTLMSDVFMRNVFKKRECTEYVLQVIMDKKDLKVIDQVLQKDYKNLQGRSAVLDCVARDAEGKQMDVEIQQDNEGASPKRARYHSGLMDMHSKILAKRVQELKETEKGVEFMCREMEQIYSEGIESGEKRGIEKGELKKAKETALSLAEMGMPVEKIAQAVRIGVETVQKWIDESISVVH